MKPELYEISDDEWENHSFKPSRVLKRPRSPPPPLESFYYKPPQPPPPPPSSVTVSDDDDCVEITRNTDNILDELDDAECDAAAAAPAAKPGRRFIIDDEDEEDAGGSGGVDLYEIDSTEDEIEEDIEDANEDDLVGKALQKCARISVELKGELFGSSGAVCDRYSEVESSSVRIVTQVMVMVDWFLLLSLVVLKCD